MESLDNSGNKLSETMEASQIKMNESVDHKNDPFSFKTTEQSNDNDLDKEEEFLKKCLFDEHDYTDLINDIKFNYKSNSESGDKKDSSIALTNVDSNDNELKRLEANGTSINNNLFYHFF